MSGNCLYCHRRKERKKGNFKTRLGLLFQLSKSSESLKSYIYFWQLHLRATPYTLIPFTSCRRKTRLLRSHDFSQFCICLSGASCLILSQTEPIQSIPALPSTLNQIKCSSFQQANSILEFSIMENAGEERKQTYLMTSMDPILLVAITTWSVKLGTTSSTSLTVSIRIFWALILV